MKSKPQAIKTVIDASFLMQYQKMIVPAIERKFNVYIDIIADTFSDTYGCTDIVIRFLCTDDTAQEIYEYIDSKWQFEESLRLIA
ncbi:hypothetical protein IGK74_001135 [Enterococcus sp. AZ150]|uniref:hypothetical protein n=1 Tax=Enterococcus sp. AZ150 TaxID=2774866 RepID=UPI003F299E47